MGALKLASLYWGSGVGAGAKPTRVASKAKMPGKGSGYRPGIPQQPYTKWDADKDEVEVDYKQLDKKGQASWFTGRKGTALKILLVVVVFSLGLILGYIIRRSVHEFIINSQRPCDQPVYLKDYSETLSSELRSYMSAENIERNLRSYTDNVHIAGTHNNNLLRDKLKLQLAEYRLRVTEARYKVLLSYPDWENPNSVSLVDGNGSVVYQTEYHGPHQQYHPELAPYNAYAPNATVKGDLVYANFGEENDFNILRQRGVRCEDNIVIMRHGRIYRGEKVRNAEKCGAAGAILYSDPAQVTRPNSRPEDQYPSSWWLPAWGTQRGSVEVGAGGGDPLTPGLPSTEGIYRTPVNEADLPRIPVQPIAYDEAETIMSHMAGPMGPTHFLGSMHHNVTYHMGPGFNTPKENMKVVLDVHNEREQRKITNVFGVIEGYEEPDQYVIVGCHYDAWTYGGVDPNSGTSVLMEVAKAFGNLSSTGWQPRRTIIFAHWDAEEPNLIGSYEWVEENMQELSAGTVAYINLDGAVIGNYTLGVQASPLFRSLVLSSSRMVAPPGMTSSGSETLYDVWTRRSGTLGDSVRPKINHVGAGSDQAAFLYTLGIPVLWMQYLHDDEDGPPSFPGYHTAIDNFDLVRRLVDPGFAAHRALAEVVGDTVLRLAAGAKLPFDVREFAAVLGEEFNALRTAAGGAVDADVYGLFNITKLEYLQWAIGNFSNHADDFMKLYSLTRSDSEYEVRRLNQQLMRLSRAFILPQGLPGRPLFRNILFAPSTVDSYSGATFTGIRDALSQFSAQPSKQHQLLPHVEQQVSIATVAVRAASRILQRTIVGS